MVTNLFPLVSVIIPVYNAQEFILETLESVLSQTYINIEVIIIDDGSTDKTLQVISKYKDKIKYFYQENSGGCSVPRNVGILKSSGDFLCFNDADDLMTADRIKTQVDFLIRNPKVGLVFSDYINFSNGAFYLNTHFQTCANLQLYLQDRKEFILDNACPFLARENFGIASSFMMRRSLLSKNIYFDPTLKSSEDFHFYYRLSQITSVGVINKVGMMRRLHTYNMSSNTKRMMVECIKSYTMLIKDEANAQARYYLNKFVADFWSCLARYNSNHGRYFLAFQQELRALYKDFCLTRLYLFSKNCMRIALMKIGLYRSKEIERKV